MATPTMQLASPPTTFNPSFCWGVKQEVTFNPFDNKFLQPPFIISAGLLIALINLVSAWAAGAATPATPVVRAVAMAAAESPRVSRVLMLVVMVFPSFRRPRSSDAQVGAGMASG